MKKAASQKAKRSFVWVVLMALGLWILLGLGFQELNAMLE